MELDDLISQVEDASVTGEPLDRLAAAMSVKADIDEVADALIGVFVDRARHAGCSWSEIGSAMGVTKQAAQQRHTSDRPSRGDRPFRMDRFTGRARAAVREAQSDASDLRHGYVGTEHLLLGVMSVPRCLAAEALASAGLTREMVLAKIEPGDLRRERTRRRHIPFTPLATKALELTLQNSVRLGHNYIGTEHILLGLLDVTDGLASKIMLESGVTKETIEAYVIARLMSMS